MKVDLQEFTDVLGKSYEGHRVKTGHKLKGEKMKTISIILAIFLFVNIAAATTVRLSNRSDYQITRFYAALSSSDNWGYNLATDRLVYPNTYLDVTTFYYDTYYDFKIVNSKGSTCILRNVYVYDAFVILKTNDHCQVIR